MFCPKNGIPAVTEKPQGRAGVEGFSMSYSDALKQGLPDKIVYFYEGGEDMDKQLRKAKDRCFMYGICVFFGISAVILKLHGFLSGMGFEARSTPMMLIDSLLYFLLFFAVISIRPMANFFFSLYCKRLQKKLDAAESTAQGS